MRRAAARIAILLVASAAMLGAVEIAIRALDLMAGERAVFDARRGAESRDETEAGADRAASRSLLHPYLGWSIRPEPGGWPGMARKNFFPDRAGAPTPWTLENLELNAFGYRSAWRDYRDVGRDELVVGVFGGSVAAHLALFAGDALADGFARATGLEPEDVAVLNLGGGGYKQPQQVATLVEMLMLGVHFDVVLNVDGFNEVAFGEPDAARGLHPFFPSSRHYLTAVGAVSGSPSEEQALLMASVIREKRAARRWLERGRRSPWLARSALARALLGLRVRDHEARAVALEQRLQERFAERAEHAGVAALSDPCLGERNRCWPLVADLWQQGSILMHEIASARGALYAHGLQPNQYVPDGKPLSEEERRVAWRVPSGFQRRVAAGYPVLQERAEALAEAGVAFFDLTDVFAGVEATRYVDDCCHANQPGYQELAREWVRRIAERKPEALTTLGRRVRERR
jgi:hypothetical protein